MIALIAFVFALALYFSSLSVLGSIDAIIHGGNTTGRMVVACILWGIFYYLTNMV